MAEQYGVSLLGQLPLDIRIREETDGGRPTVVAEPASSIGRAYFDTARRTSARLSLAAAAAPGSPYALLYCLAVQLQVKTVALDVRRCLIS